ncbi:MAG: hypothetical protein D6696_08360 [Acidobacteria bacterium]|nr:MAG: hypothetical protein D6696_08360 [Acidobacteriota bacterium]
MNPADDTRDPLAKLLRWAFWPFLALLLAAGYVVLFRLDLTPRVESDFFFASDDPALQASNEIARLFPSGEQLFITARVSDPLAPETLERIEQLSAALETLPGVATVQSLTRGPLSPRLAVGSPLWGRLLLTPGDPRVTHLVVTLDGRAGRDDRRPIARLEALVAAHDAPSFALAMSGVPYVVEQIRRALARDLRTFSLASLVVFGLVIALVYRSPRIVAGTLLSCLGACALTLVLLAAIGTPIGVLTANIVTIVFVLTLSHAVFLTANRRALGSAEEAVRATFGPSFWAMTTTLCGFLSLLLASARPLRELAASGAAGTVVAMVVAYGFYPRFLTGDGGGLAPHKDDAVGRLLAGGAERPAALALGLTVAVAALGLPRIDTDPSLFDFFAPGGEIRRGIEVIDASGGSSPLLIVVRDPASPDGKLDGDDSIARLTALQAAFEADPATGVCLSLPVLLAEARRVPLAVMMTRDQLLRVLDSERFGRVARSFVTADRQRALFVLRMREAGRREPRRAIIARLQAAVAAQGLEAELVGGIFDLQARLGGLVGRSLAAGLAGLLVLFLFIAALVARRLRVAAAMVVALAAVPVIQLGTFGLFGLPVDFISSPAANVAIALGIDGMIHLVSAVRRERRSALAEGEAWRRARLALGRPIAGAMLILASGFGIFALSSFPPTQRFGLAVALGTVTAAAMTLVVMPLLARTRR